MKQLRLLCATDLSRRSDGAVRRALLLSEQIDAELLLFHSVTGQHHSAIADMALEWGADLIILGARTERLGESIVGTTAERVSRKAGRPILVVNRDVAGPYEHVLLTSDLTDVSAGAARLADDLGMLEGGLTAVVHSLSAAGRSMLRASGVSEPALETYARGMSQWTSQEILQQLEHAGLSTERLSVLAHPSPPLRAIEHAARLTDADLVVVGASQYPMLKRIVLGSVSNEVLRSLSCDVLLVSPGAIEHARAQLH